MSKISKSLFGLLSCVFAIALFTLPVSAATLADGEYTITVTAMEEEADSEHTRNEDLVNTAKLEVSGGKIVAYVTSSGRELKFADASGEFSNEIVSEDDAGKTYKLTLSSLDEAITTQFPAGGSPTGAMTFRLVFDSSTLAGGPESTDTSADTSTSSSSSAATEAEKTTSAEKVTSPKTGDYIQYVVVILAVAFVAMIAVTILSKRKNSVSK